MSKLVRFDWAIKHLLRDKANFGILEGFLSAVIGEEILVQELLESEGNQEHEKDKYNRVDLLVKNQKDELIFIEVQVEEQQDFFQRIGYGASKLIAQYIQMGKPYSDIKKVISVSIAYFDLGVGMDYVYHGSTNFVGMKRKDKLALNETQKLLYGAKHVYQLFAEYYLLRVGMFDDHVGDDLDEWVYMLKNDEVEPDFQAKHIQEAGERLRYMSLNKQRRQEYEHYLENLRYRASMEQTELYKVKQEGIEEGMAQGVEKGMVQGALQEKRNNARNALQTGLSIQQVSAITGLSEDEIAELAEE